MAEPQSVRPLSPGELQTLKNQHPTWNIVDATTTPYGGIWALGADGGVFALDGAPFFNSYLGLPAEARQGTRTFTLIDYNPTTGGYDLTADDGAVYSAQFGNPAGNPFAVDDTKTTTPGQAPISGPDPSYESLRYFFTQMGLTGMIDDAWKYFKSLGADAELDDIYPWLRQQRSFKDRFPGMEHLEKKGIYWDPADYLEYEQSIQQAGSRAGISKEYFEREDIATLIRNDWSLDEVNEAISAAERAVLNLPSEVWAQARRWNVNGGDLVGFWLNPDKGYTLLERKAMEEKLGIGAGMGGLGFEVSSGWAGEILKNVGAEGAAQNMQRLAASRGLFDETVGEERTRDVMGATLAAEFVGGPTAHRTAAGERIERRRERRRAAFEGGGGAAGGGAGMTGLGTAR